MSNGNDIVLALGGDGSEIMRKLKEVGETTWGFVIYRCTYKNDDEWQRFMDILNARVQEHLVFEGDEYILESLDWAIQEDSSYEGASVAEIRRVFDAYISPSDLRSPRGGFCMVVDQESVESALNGPQPPENDLYGKAYAKVVDRKWCIEYDDDLVEDRAEYDADGNKYEIGIRDLLIKGKNPKCDGLDPIDGCTAVDVGWMKVDLGSIGPTLFNKLWGQFGDNWEICYSRPPRVARL